MFDRCRAWRRMMTRRADGALSPSERALLDDHIARCADCRTACEADEALHDLLFTLDDGARARSGRAFDDRVVSELRAMPLREAPAQGWRERLRAYSIGFSFEFVMQLAGGGLAAAGVTAYVLVSALNPVPAARSLSAYEVRTLSAVERNEPPVPLESLFQSPTPRAAMLWAAPGSPQWRRGGVEPAAASARPVRPERRSAPRRHGSHSARRFVSA